MKIFFKFLFLVLFFVALLAGGLFLRFNQLVKTKATQELLISQIEEATDSSIHYQDFETLYFSRPKAIIRNSEIVFYDEKLTIEAKEASFELDLFSLLLGKIRISSMQLNKGTMRMLIPPFENIQLENIHFKVGSVKPKIPIPVSFSCGISGKENVFSIKGNVTIDSYENWDWDSLGINLITEIKDFSLGSDVKLGLEKYPFVFLKQGEGDASFSIIKERDKSSIDIKGKSDFRNIVYEIAENDSWIFSPVIVGKMNFDGAWNYKTDELDFRQFKIISPIADFEINGGLNLRSREIHDMRISVFNVTLESIPQYLPAIKEVVPYKIGFSGSSNIEMSLDGTAEHLSLSLNWDLSDALLTYANYFNKPKDESLIVTFDYLIQSGKTFTGDFSIKFKDIGVKGNITDFDKESGEGQLNLITNKFQLDGWEKLVPAFEKYQIKGTAKILANWKGNLKDIGTTDRIFHITIEDGAWLTSEGEGIQHAFLSFDYSPLMIEGRKMNFEIGGSSVAADLMVYGFPKNTNAKGHIESEEIYPSKAWRAFRALFQNVEEKESEENVYNYVHKLTQNWFPEGNSLKDFSAEVQFQKSKWNIKDLRFNSYDGEIILRGEIDFSGARPNYWWDTEINSLSIRDFLNRKKEEVRFLDGDFYFKSFLQGEGWGFDAWNETLSGEGNFTVEGGEFYTMDLISVLAEISPFRGLKNYTVNAFSFNELDFKWILKQGRIETKNLLLKREKIVIDGKGSVRLDGMLNFKLDSYFSPVLTGELLPGFVSSLKEKEREDSVYLGPVTILLSGPIDSPNLKPDPTLVTQLVKNISKRKTKNILYRLLID